MSNPYFLNPREATVEIGDDIYYATIYDRPNGKKAVELQFQTEENYWHFAKKYIYRSGSKFRFHLLSRIAGSSVIEKNEIIVGLLSHNSDYYKATYIFE